MKRTNIVIQVINSGVIPLLVGVFIIFNAPDFVWALIGFGFVLVGLFFGNDYIEKAPKNTSEKEIES